MEGSNTQSQKRPRIESSTRSAMLTDIDVLDCPVCFEPLTIPTFQCNDGHLICCSCFAKVSNKCPGPACDLPVGNKRCFSMEKVLKKVLVPCLNAEFGCPNSYHYGNSSNHEKDCEYFKFSCPKLGCSYTGSITGIYSHFVDSHLNDTRKIFMGRRGTLPDAYTNINEKNLVLWENNIKLLFVIQSFTEEHGVYITFRRISSSVPDLKKYRYRLTYSKHGHTLYYESPEVKRFLDS